MGGNLSGTLPFFVPLRRNNLSALAANLEAYIVAPRLAAPCCLYETSSPCAPLLRIEPESVARRNCDATNFKSSAFRAKASTSVRVWTVLVEMGSSSPQKSPALRYSELKKPVLPPFVVMVNSLPRIMKSISSTGSPSRTM
ncbi:hypothetical protein CR513_37119, partial [Mucuna pruriens]